jgi:predicted Fe-S protein YdhL (DUF1289 family)
MGVRKFRADCGGGVVKPRLRPLCGFDGNRHDRAAMPSPCRKICVYDPLRGLCAGCGRTLDEIEHWLEMSEDQQRAVMDRLQERLRPMPPQAN